MNDSIAIQVDGLGKRYQRGSKRTNHTSIRDAIVEGARSLFKPRAPDEGTFWALKDARFDVRHGENVGVIGLNGAGKSTLLKMLSRITHPTVGHARLNGRVGALLEVGTGFHGELTGRENMFLYGAILGMSRQEILKKFDAIVDFSGIEAFIDTPVKRYSSGMYVRLAFSVAAHLDPEILLLDEVLAVGDFAFQKRCMDFAKSLQQRDATIMFVSHNMFSIKTMCERVIYLKQGRVVFDGATDKGIELYEQDCRLSTVSWLNQKADEMSVNVSDCELTDLANRPKKLFEYGERMRLRIALTARKPNKKVNLIVALKRSDGVSVCNYYSETDDFAIRDLEGTRVIELDTPPLKLVAELYSIEVYVRDAATQELLCGQVGASFHVTHTLFDTHFGVFHEQAEWRNARSATEPALTQLAV